VGVDIRRLIRRAAGVCGLWVLAGIASASSLAAAAIDEGCLRVDAGAELTVTGVGRAVFAVLATDRVRDAAVLSGGVCVAFSAIDGVLLTERLEITGLGRDVARLEAADVVLEVPGWSIGAELLVAVGDRLSLAGVTLRGRDAVARAVGMTLDLTSGAIVAHAVVLATETAWVRASSASFAGDAVSLRDVALTTCDCLPEDAGVRLEARSAELDLDGAGVRLGGAELVTGALRWPLPDPWSFDAAALADLAPPVAIFEDPAGRRGTLVGVAERSVAPGVRFAWDAALGAGLLPSDLWLRVAARAGDASIDVTGATDRLRVAWRAAWPFADHWSLAFAQRLEGGAWDEPVRDQSVALSWSRAWPAPAAAVSRVQLDGSTFAALTAQSLAAGERIGTRIGATLQVRVTGDPIGSLRPTLEAAAGLTGYPPGLTDYPADGTSQAWLTLSPRLSGAWGPVRLDLGHLSRWVAGVSPFGVGVDRLAPVHRTDLQATVAFGDAALWSGTVGTTVRWDWRSDAQRPGRAVGLERLDLRVAAAGPTAGGRFRVAVDAVLAGLLDPRSGRSPSVGGTAVWERGSWELGTRWRVDPANPSWPWRTATVFAAVPFDVGDLWLRPYLAVDLAAWARGDARPLAGHGLDLAWAQSFGVIEAGYRFDDGAGVALSLGLRFTPRPLDLERLPVAAVDGP
jgi:hypothetical protein